MGTCPYHKGACPNQRRVYPNRRGACPYSFILDDTSLCRFIYSVASVPLLPLILLLITCYLLLNHACPYQRGACPYQGGPFDSRCFVNARQVCYLGFVIWNLFVSWNLFGYLEFGYCDLPALRRRKSRQV